MGRGNPYEIDQSRSPERKWTGGERYAGYMAQLISGDSRLNVHSFEKGVFMRSTENGNLGIAKLIFTQNYDTINA